MAIKPEIHIPLAAFDMQGHVRITDDAMILDLARVPELVRAFERIASELRGPVKVGPGRKSGSANGNNKMVVKRTRKRMRKRAPRKAA